MKYKIRTVDDSVKFRPYEVTLLIETPEDHRVFHDKVACEIAQSSQFIGDVYMAGRNVTLSAGDVPLK